MLEGARANLLVVDDNQANLALLVEILGTDYEVAVAMNGRAALEAVALALPDLILLDIMMPEMDGYEVCRRLKAVKKFADIPVIFVTAMADNEDEATGLAMGAVDYITKPVSPPVVLARVATHLNLHKAYIQLERQNVALKDYARLRDEVERITRHDLKTPLGSVISGSSLLVLDESLTPEQRSILEIIQKSGYRMLELINSSVDMFKMELGKYQLKPVQVNLIDIIKEILSELREIIISKKVGIKLNVCGKSGTEAKELYALGEEMLYYSMLSNLIKNAVEASPKEALLTIELEDKEALAIFINNRGVVPEDIRETFFDKFSTSGKRGGTGLGTYSARLIAKTLGGELSMESSEATGTTLTFLLPSMTPKTAAQQESSRVNPGRKLDLGMNILVADDQRNMRTIVKGMLRHMGFNNIISVENGCEGLRVVQSQIISCIISDNNMPEMSGIEFLTQLRSNQKTKNIPFIMLTGEAEYDSVIQASKANANDYIIKPFTADTLMKKLRNIFI